MKTDRFDVGCDIVAHDLSPFTHQTRYRGPVLPTMIIEEALYPGADELRVATGGQ
jgi:hypothetical protein